MIVKNYRYIYVFSLPMYLIRYIFIYYLDL